MYNLKLLINIYHYYYYYYYYYLYNTIYNDGQCKLTYSEDIGLIASYLIYNFLS